MLNFNYVFWKIIFFAVFITLGALQGKIEISEALQGMIEILEAPTGMTEICEVLLETIETCEVPRRGTIEKGGVAGEIGRLLETIGTRGETERHLGTIETGGHQGTIGTDGGIGAHHGMIGICATLSKKNLSLLRMVMINECVF